MLKKIGTLVSVAAVILLVLVQGTAMGASSVVLWAGQNGVPNTYFTSSGMQGFSGTVSNVPELPVPPTHQSMFGVSPATANSWCKFTYTFTESGYFIPQMTIGAYQATVSCVASWTLEIDNTEILNGNFNINNSSVETTFTNKWGHITSQAYPIRIEAGQTVVFTIKNTDSQTSWNKRFYVDAIRFEAVWWNARIYANPLMSKSVSIAFKTDKNLAPNGLTVSVNEGGNTTNVVMTSPRAGYYIGTYHAAGTGEIKVTVNALPGDESPAVNQEYSYIVR